jgi:hypothetical protein
VPLRRLVNSGAILVEKTPGAMPLAAWARLTDSQEALALALGDAALAFYAGLMNIAEQYHAAQETD